MKLLKTFLILSLCFLFSQEIEPGSQLPHVIEANASFVYIGDSLPDLANPKFINVIIQVSTYLPPTDFASVLIFIEDDFPKFDQKIL